MITQWHLLYVPLGRYLGYSITLQHVSDGRYKILLRCPWEAGEIASDRTFSLEKKEEAIAHARELIDADVSPILPL